MNSQDLIDRLRQFGDLEWFRHSGGVDVDGIAVPPLLVWRFSEPRPIGLIDVFREIVSDPNLEVDWSFDAERRNWVLMPSLLLAERAKRRLGTAAEARSILMAEDQDFCRRSVSDLDRIVNALDRIAGEFSG
ncbi:hypothetical protein [Nocardia sp. NPDC005978]|uniref:hypothetical protein n=1 Tax=unclassified Nocardia TaxID=2637762 RepID=UPI0033BE8E67